MTATKYPWSDVISDDDLASFDKGISRLGAPIEAGIRPAIVVVDMTWGFVDSRYSSGWSPTGYPAVEAISRLLSAARPLDIPVFFTKSFEDPKHYAKPAERGKWKRSMEDLPLDPGPTSSDLPPSDQIVDDLKPLANDIVVHKAGKPSGFFGTPLASYLIDAGCDTVIVTGMSTSGCVRATAIDAFQYNFNLVIPADCVADRCQTSHKVTLFDIHMKYGDVASLDDVIRYLHTDASR
ncbi:isochorismatase family protein [Dactylosporangium sp. NPDC000555]|uniref:isochorismatase family protein n=1 Tax=Dactylosporangium sp. NPDC000555 TaxID=3154260 RepID=UPI003317D43B